MNQQKQTSKASSSFVSSLPAASGIEETKFLGYENLESDSKGCGDLERSGTNRCS